MQDKLLTCQNCQNPFVYSAYEQTKNQKNTSGQSQSSTINLPAEATPQALQAGDLSSIEPKYCPICTAIKQSELKHPPKPQK